MMVENQKREVNSFSDRTKFPMHKTFVQFQKFEKGVHGALCIFTLLILVSKSFYPYFYAVQRFLQCLFGEN